MEFGKLDSLIDTTVLENQEKSKLSYSSVKGRLICSLCETIRETSRTNPGTEFTNCFPGAGRNYDNGVVFITNSQPTNDFRFISAAVGDFIMGSMEEFGINNYYVVPAIKCNTKALSIKTSGKIKDNCLSLTKVMLKEYLKPKVIMIDDVSIFNTLTGMKFYSAGKIANYVLWSSEFNCYMMLILNIRNVLTERAIEELPELESVKKSSLKNGFRKAAKLMEGTYKEHIYRFENPHYEYISSRTTESRIQEVFQKLSNSDSYALDIETTGLVPWESKVTMVGISCQAGESFVFPFQFVQDRKDFFQELFLDESKKKIFANGFFDVSFLTYHGFPFKGPFVDILALNYLIRNGIDYDVSTTGVQYSARMKMKGSNNLKFLAWYFTDLGGYEQELKSAGGILRAQEDIDETEESQQMSLFENFLKEEIDAESIYTVQDAQKFQILGELPPGNIGVVEKYNAIDTDATFRIEVMLQKILKKEVYEFYQDMMAPLIFEVLVRIYLNGIHVDLEYISKLQEEYAGADGEGGKLKELRDAFSKALKTELYRNKYVTEEQLKDIFKKDLKEYPASGNFLDSKELKKEMLLKANININSPTQILKAYKAMGFLGPEDSSVDGKVLQHLIEQGRESAKIKAEYQPISKLYTTYVKAIKEKQVNGFLHSQFHAYFTATGRLSSSDPNMQNIPADNVIRNIFIPRPGYSFIDLDYSQMELRVVAEYAKDQTFIDTFNGENPDPHWDMAKKMFSIAFPYRPSADDPDHIQAVKELLDESNEDKVKAVIKDWDKKRGFAKTLNFSILYGSSAYGVAGNIYSDFDYVSDRQKKQYVNECQKLIDSWFESVPGVARWMRDNYEFAKKNRYVENMFGRIRWLVFVNSNFPKFSGAAKREAGNTPIQSTASDICCMAAIKFQKFIDSPEHRGDDCRIVNIVHDNILAEVPDEKAEYYFNALSKIMREDSNPLKLVPLDVDGKITKRWEK